MQSVASCPICGSKRHSAFDSVEDRLQILSYRVCWRCGHVFQSPRMSPEELAAFYGAEYRLLQQGTDEPVEKDLMAQEARAVVTLRLIADELRAVSRHLDVGSSSGALLEAFRDLYHCSGAGVEPGEAYRRYSQSRGLRIFPSMEDVVKAKEPLFDLVTLMHVVEHFPDPVATLRQIRKEHMLPEAFLLVEVPNLADHQSFELAHLHAFSPSSITDAVRRAGFQVVWSRVHGGYRSPVLGLYVTLLARATGTARARWYFPLAALRSRLMRTIGTSKRQFLTRRYPDWTWQSPEKVLPPRQIG